MVLDDSNMPKFIKLPTIYIYVYIYIDVQYFFMKVVGILVIYAIVEWKDCSQIINMIMPCLSWCINHKLVMMGDNDNI